MNNAEILIIDDEPQIRKLLEITLESNDYRVWQAATGKEGILMAANHTPELILLDLGLPDKSGHEVLKELRTWYNTGQWRYRLSDQTIPHRRTTCTHSLIDTQTYVGRK